jgi:curved DNA-binding protein CbpA
MRLFHPDRNAAHDTWTEHFASRVNLAWKVLSKQNSRASYDEGLTRSRALILVQSAPYTMGGAARGPAGGNHRPRQSQRPVRPRANPSHRWRSALILNGMALGVIAFLVWEHFPEQTLRAPLTEDLRLSADAGLPLPNLQSAVKPTEPPTRQPSTPDRATAQTTAQETQGINREPDKNRDAQIEPGSDGMGLEKALKAAQSLVERMVLEGRSLDRSGGPPIQGERSEAEQEAETEQRRLKFAQEKGLLLAGQGGTLLASQTQPAVAPVEVMRTPDPKPVPEAARDQRPRQGKVNQTYRKGQPSAGRSTVQWRRTKSWYGTRGSKRR